MNLGGSLKLRRQIMGLSLRALAEKIGVSHTTIDKFEKDRLVPDSPSLIKLSVALQTPVAAFLRPPNQQVQLHRLAFRSKKMRKKDEKQINAETKEWLERYLQAESLTGKKTLFRRPRGFPRDMFTFEDAEKASEDLRAEWDLGTDPIENLTNLLEDKGIKIGIIKGITKFDALFTEYDGHSIIVMKEDLPRVRQRFSLAHELGHCLLKAGVDTDPEKLMHRFAGAFLVPREKVIFELGEKRRSVAIKELFLLKKKYGLSMGAWLFRAKDLGIITQADFVEKRKIFSSKGWNKKEPGDEEKGELPILMNSILLKAHAEGIISTPKAAELLNQTISMFCSLEGETDIEESTILCA